MGHILHDWNLDEKRMLLRKAYDALPSGGALLVHEAIIDDARKKNALGLLMSLNMLIETPGGFDFTGADCTRWMKEAGFKGTKVVKLVGPDSMVVGIKNKWVAADRTGGIRRFTTRRIMRVTFVNGRKVRDARKNERQVCGRRRGARRHE